MILLDLMEKYCERDGEEYITLDHCFDIKPASEEEYKTFAKRCHQYGAEGSLVSELRNFYRQTKSLFGYVTCDDEIIFEWWQDSKELWLGNLHMDTFRYSAEKKKSNYAP